MFKKNHRLEVVLKPLLAMTPAASTPPSSIKWSYALGALANPISQLAGRLLFPPLLHFCI
jgi:hypothetical protein